jgi:hypothetical protein
VPIKQPHPIPRPAAKEHRTHTLAIKPHVPFHATPRRGRPYHRVRTVLPDFRGHRANVHAEIRVGFLEREGVSDPFVEGVAGGEGAVMRGGGGGNGEIRGGMGAEEGLAGGRSEVVVEEEEFCREFAKIGGRLRVCCGAGGGCVIRLLDVGGFVTATGHDLDRSIGVYGRTATVTLHTVVIEVSLLSIIDLL